MTVTQTIGAIETIEQLERERGRALVAADWSALEGLIADDLVHIHANGAIEDRAGYFDSVRNKLQFIAVEREALRVRSHGETAIATGILRQTLRVRDSGTVFEMRIATTQVWTHAGGRWVQASFHATHVQ
jgi:ketosteroid isomerase-like protein